MIICKICNKEFKNFKGLTSHLRYHNISSKKYYDNHIKLENEVICECGNKTSFISISKGYCKFCSNKCTSNSIKTKEKCKQTCLKNYNCENVLQNKEIKEKIKKTNLEKYGYENPNKNKEIKEKIKNTNLEKYNTYYVFQNKEIKEKIKKTNIEKYGVEYSSQNKEIKEKIKQTNLKKYGFKCSLQNKEIKEKVKQTNLERYGYENPIKNKEIKEKIKQTNLERYGVDNPNKTKEVREKIKKTNLEKYGYENPIKNKEIKEKIKYNRLNSIIKKIHILLKNLNLELLSKYNNNKELIILKCLKCNTIFKSNYFNLYQNCGKCPNCFPYYKSNGELELLSFIKLIEPTEIIENDRNILNGKELDIYIPSKNIAIEFNGLYWHSEGNGKDKNYHLNKTNLCKSKNIRLIHIFEDEWIFKQEIVKSRLKQLLKINNSERIHARKCIIKKISPKIKNEFLNEFHIQGEDRSSIKLGAFYNDELISVMTFSHGNISKGSKKIEGIYELSRFCSNNNYHIPGIASKLLSYFKNNYKWKEIYSYADRRWSDGNVYKKIGFDLEHITKPNYFYIKNGIRIHRFNLRKRSDEPKDIPEWILRSNEGYYRIWDCGHYKFII